MEVACVVRSLRSLIVVAMLMTWTAPACERAEPSGPPTAPRTASATASPSGSPSVVVPYEGIWPAETAEEAVASQQAVDTGTDLWLLDPARVAASYVRSVRGWWFPDVRKAGPRTLEVTDRGSGAVLRVEVLQPVTRGESGIWVVSAAAVVTDDNLPSAVARTRDAILVACIAGDYEGLRRLIEEGFVYSFGGGEDPIAHWKEREADWGEHPLDTMAAILSMPYVKLRTDVGAFYAWPAVYAREPSTLTGEEQEMLSAVYPDIEQAVESWTAFGAYVGWRMGIERDGTWAFFVEGD